MSDLQLSNEEMERVLSKLHELLPDREILTAVGNTLREETIGRLVFEGRPVTLEKAIEVFHSRYEWRYKGDTLELEESDSYEIWIEKILPGKVNNPNFLPPYIIEDPEEAEKQAENPLELESVEVCRAFYEAGIMPGFRHMRSCYLVPEPERKEYWPSWDIMRADFCVEKPIFSNAQSDVRGSARLIHPGYYAGNIDGWDCLQFEKNIQVVILEINPFEYKGVINNCALCRGRNYEGEPKVKFLFTGVKHLIPLICEYCLPEYLNQIGEAFRRFSAENPTK